MTTLTLARFEGRRLLLHPAIGVGVVLTALGYWLVDLDQHTLALVDPAAHFEFTLALVPLAWSLMVAMTLTVLRSRRAGTDELLESLPASRSCHTAAHMLSATAVVPVAVVVLVVASVVAHLRSSAIGWVPLAPATGTALIVLGAGASAVLLARWIPHPIVAPVGIVATLVLQANLRAKDVKLRWLHFSPGDEYGSPFDIRLDGWHVVYLVGLIGIAAVLALGRHGLTRPVVVGGAVAMAVVVASGVAQTRPATAAQLAAQKDRLVNPQRHQVCQVRRGVEFCTYPGYQPWATQWSGPVAGVMARLPASARARPLAVTQRALPNIHLVPALAASIDATEWPAADADVHPSLEWTAAHELSLAYQVSAWATGLPTRLGRGAHACSAGGQARVVVAIWLAAQASPRADREARRRAAALVVDGLPAWLRLQPLDAVESFDPDDGTGQKFDEEVASAGRGADVVAATRLLDAPHDRVASAVRTHWSELVDPVTPSSRLFEVVGIATPSVATGLPAVTPGVGRACA